MATEKQHRVRHGMVADEVSCGVDAAGEVGALADEATDEEEGRADVVSGEDFEKLLSAGVVGAVVIGEGVFVRVLSGEDRPAEDLRRGPHGGVEVSADGETSGDSEAGGSGAESGEHPIQVYGYGIGEEQSSYSTQASARQKG